MNAGKENLGNSHGSLTLDDVRLDGSPLRGSKPSLQRYNLHDQLPDIEEYKTAQQVTKSTKVNVKAIVFAVSMIAIASTLITIGVVIGRDTAPRDTGSNKTGREEDFAAFLVNMGWADSVDMASHTSPQYKAMQWLANEDPFKMPLSMDVDFMQRYVAATLYFALGGPEWMYDLQFLSATDACSWNALFDAGGDAKVKVGISCRPNGGFIHEIFLPNVGLKGELPKEIGLLLDLEDLNLFSNSISGGLPDSMKNLINLETLVLHNNKISTPIPDWILQLKKLHTLNLASNAFFGSIPNGMGSALKSLKTLSLEINDFSGDLVALRGLDNLDALYLGNNTFNGELDDEIFESWERLKIMDISDNLLSSTLPTMLLAKPSLTVIDLHGNNLEGELPSIVDLGSNVEFLALHDNKLSGPIPIRLKGMDKLAHLDLSMNAFTGDMPAFLGDVSTLKYLFLAFNENLDAGIIPSEYSQLTNLVDLSLQATKRIGKFPSSFESLHKNLVLLDLNDNLLTGTLPTQIGYMTALQFLLLHHNKLDGSIPSTLEKLTLLDTLVLDGNMFSDGSIHLCSPALSSVSTRVSTCGASFACTCCKCCTVDDASCDELKWFSGVDPIAEGGYVRDDYMFHENGIVFPAPKEPASYYTNYSGYYNTP